MKTVLSLVKILCYILALPTLGALVFLIWAYAKVTFFQQTDNADKIISKHAYLAQLQDSDIANAPNIVFVLYDDLGYGDLQHPLIDTPHIDQLAKDGIVFSQFYAPAHVCTPSRAGYLTGRVPPRAGLTRIAFPPDHPALKAGRFFADGAPSSHERLPFEEITIAEILQAAGYHTGMIGKWHLGDKSPSLPNEMGFDYFYGALYSNDMTPYAFYKNQQIDIPAPVDQTKLSTKLQDESINFIDQHTDKPFFLYLAHPFPHIPLYSNDENAGRSGAGLYGDVVEELDDGIGVLVRILKEKGEYRNTIFILTSDNGPWFQGSTSDLRGRKGQSFEGGMRVPMIIAWPDHMDQYLQMNQDETNDPFAPISMPHMTTSNQLATGVDILPTILDILAINPPRDRALDGQSLMPILTDDEAIHDYVYYYADQKLHAIRDKRFKYRPEPLVYYGPDPMGWAFKAAEGPVLVDLLNDPTESFDVSNLYTDDLARLQQAFEAKEKEMQENIRGWK